MMARLRGGRTMRVEAFVSTMHQTDHSILERMNIQTDAIVINQSDSFGLETFMFREHTVRFYTLPERGIGLSRNTSLMRAAGDIGLFADDDLVYVDGYEKMLLQAFQDHTDMDVLVFNIESIGNKRNRFMISKPIKIGFSNYMRYGAARIAVRVKRVIEKNISFSLLFGGGALYGSGEDTLFLHDCLKAGLKLYGMPLTLAKIDDSESTWFRGYDQKFYMDKGTLFSALYGKMAWLYCLRFAMTHKSLINNGRNERKQALYWLLQGSKRI